MGNYLIYGSYNNGRYKAMDLNAGVQVGNLIYASMFQDKETAEKVCKQISLDNDEWKFEVRKAG